MILSRATAMWSNSAVLPRIWLLFMLALAVIDLATGEWLGGVLMLVVVGLWIRCIFLWGECRRLEQLVETRKESLAALGQHEDFSTMKRYLDRGWRGTFAAWLGVGLPLLLALIGCLGGIVVALIMGWQAGVLVFFTGGLSVFSAMVATANRDMWATRLRTAVV